MLPASKDGDRESLPAYPFGRHSWVVSACSASDVSVCGRQGGERITLTFSSCFPEMFTCQNGDCIPLAKKCDTNLDCLDESDESDCSYLAKDDQGGDGGGGGGGGGLGFYNRNIIPRNTSDSGESELQLAVVISFEVRRLLCLLLLAVAVVVVVLTAKMQI